MAVRRAARRSAPAVRRSCQTSARCSGSPVDGSQTHDRLALVGDADGLQLARAAAGVLERLAGDRVRDLPDLGRVVLDPAGAREVLGELAVGAARAARRRRRRRGRSCPVVPWSMARIIAARAYRRPRGNDGDAVPGSTGPGVTGPAGGRGPAAESRLSRPRRRPVAPAPLPDGGVTRGEDTPSRRLDRHVVRALGQGDRTTDPHDARGRSVTGGDEGGLWIRRRAEHGRQSTSGQPEFPIDTRSEHPVGLSPRGRSRATILGGEAVGGRGLVQRRLSSTSTKSFSCRPRCRNPFSVRPVARWVRSSSTSPTREARARGVDGHADLHPEARGERDDDRQHLAAHRALAADRRLQLKPAEAADRAVRVADGEAEAAADRRANDGDGQVALAARTASTSAGSSCGGRRQVAVAEHEDRRVVDEHRGQAPARRPASPPRPCRCSSARARARRPPRAATCGVPSVEWSSATRMRGAAERRRAARRSCAARRSPSL